MIRELFGFIFSSRLDRMTTAQIVAAMDDGTLTFGEVKRVCNYSDMAGRFPKR